MACWLYEGRCGHAGDAERERRKHERQHRIAAWRKNEQEERGWAAEREPVQVRVLPSERVLNDLVHDVEREAGLQVQPTPGRWLGVVEIDPNLEHGRGTVRRRGG